MLFPNARIAVFYHCLFCLGDPPEFLPNAFGIVRDQMLAVEQSGLLSASENFVVGVNGGEESGQYASLVIPQNARVIMHGLHSRAENPTIIEIEKWCRSHPGWCVLYFHSKGATHPADSPYSRGISAPWRDAMMQDLVWGWRNCIAAIASGAEVVCSHFMRGMADGSQNIACGNFWWAASEFLATLPSMYLRDRIKQSGIASLESRFEAEVWIGNGRMPIVHEFRPGGGGGVP